MSSYIITEDDKQRILEMLYEVHSELLCGCTDASHVTVDAVLEIITRAKKVENA